MVNLMDFRRTGIGFLVLCLLLGAVPALAQTPPEGAITWEDSPNPRPVRHLGDWMVNAGWYAPEAVYGPFDEGEFAVGDRVGFTVSSFETSINPPPC